MHQQNPKLTEQDLAVVRLVAEGKSNKEIALEIERGVGTVKDHVAAASGKLWAGQQRVGTNDMTGIRINRTLSLLLSAVALTVAGVAMGQLLRSDAEPRPQPSATVLISDGGRRVFTSSQRATFTTPDELVSASQTVVIAKFKSFEKVHVGVASQVDGQVHGTREDEIRRFDVIEVLKGDVGSEELEIFLTRANSIDLPGGDSARILSEFPAFTPGVDYVLFLRAAVAPGSSAPWFLSGEPGAARIDGENVTYVVTPAYATELEQIGTPRGASGAAKNFDLTLNQLRSLTR